MGDFPGSPVVRTLHFHTGAWVQSLIGELRSHKLFGVAKPTNKQKVSWVVVYVRPMLSLDPRQEDLSDHSSVARGIGDQFPQRESTNSEYSGCRDQPTESSSQVQ